MKKIKRRYVRKIETRGKKEKNKNRKKQVAGCEVQQSMYLIQHHAFDTRSGQEVQLHTFLISALDGGEGSDSRSGHFTLRQRVRLYALDRTLGGPQRRAECGDVSNLPV
jgi:hypothetical protein